MDQDIFNVAQWLDGSDWSYDMYMSDTELERVFDENTVKKYWSYKSILLAMGPGQYEGWRDVLFMLKHSIGSNWDMNTNDYYNDIADAWGTAAAKKFNLQAIVSYIEERRT